MMVEIWLHGYLVAHPRLHTRISIARGRRVFSAPPPVPHVLYRVRRDLSRAGIQKLSLRPLKGPYKALERAFS